jgi:hypothetical protein
MTGLSTIKNWFLTGLKPTQTQFHAWMDSFWHKSEMIPTNKIEGLEEILNTNFNIDQLANKVDKQANKSLILDSEITRLASLTNQTKQSLGLENVDNTTDVNKPISAATQLALNAKANIASPTFTGTVGGITKAMVGLPNVDNTTDANKPISTATQLALNNKANNANPVFTGNGQFATVSIGAPIAFIEPGDVLYGNGGVKFNGRGRFNGTVSASPGSTPNEVVNKSQLDTKVDVLPGERLINATEITKLANQSGNNTGDETAPGIKSKRPLKTVDGQSIEGTGNINSILAMPFRVIVDLGNVSDVVNIDWHLGVKYKLNLTRNTVLNQLNYEGYEGQKVQELEITSSSPAHTITWNLITPSEFTDAISFATDSTFNNVSIRLLRGIIFQSNNLVR